MGLASPGGVHAHQDHMVALAREVTKAGVPVAVHAFLDGRDVPPQSAAGQITKFREICAMTGVQDLRPLCGRYYAMDRDKRWERVDKAYDLVTQGEGAQADDAVTAIEASYAANVTDEFVLPVALNGYAGHEGRRRHSVRQFPRRPRAEILTALLDPAFNGFARKKTVRFAGAAGMVEYSDKLNLLMTRFVPAQEDQRRSARSWPARA